MTNGKDWCIIRPEQKKTFWIVTEQDLTRARSRRKEEPSLVGTVMAEWFYRTKMVVGSITAEWLV